MVNMIFQQILSKRVFANNIQMHARLRRINFFRDDMILAVILSIAFLALTKLLIQACHNYCHF